MVRLGLEHGASNSELRKGERRCGECGSPFRPKRHDQVFCSGPCRFADHNRAMQRGREAYRAMYHWRHGAGKGERGSLIGTVSAMAKRWIEEDQEAGRGPPPLPEDMVLRRMNARTGYVRQAGAGYVHNPDKAAKVLKELAG
jgi:hypothetical protein